MSVFYKTDIHQSPKETADRKNLEYRFVLTLICVALALAVASAKFAPAPVGSGIGNDVLVVGP